MNNNVVISSNPEFSRTSLALSRVPFLLLLRFGFEGTVGSKALSDLQEWCRCSILHLINGVTCTHSLHENINWMDEAFVVRYTKL